MGAIDDFKAEYDLHTAALTTALGGIAGDIQSQTTQIEELKALLGTISPEAQAKLNEVLATQASLASQAQALDDLNPPAVPNP